MNKGTQVAYVPTHAKGNLSHKDVEFGFVTSIHPDGKNAFCRYWRKGDEVRLRTVANSELTPMDRLIEYETVPQYIVNHYLEVIERGELQ